MPFCLIIENQSELHSCSHRSLGLNTGSYWKCTGLGGNDSNESELCAITKVAVDGADGLKAITMQKDGTQR